MTTMDFEKELREFPAGRSGDESMLDPMLAEGRRRLSRALKRVARPQAKVGEIDTPLGPLFVAESERGIVAVRFIDGADFDRELDALRARFDLAENRAAANKIGDEIRRHLAGDNSALAHRIDLSLVPSEFQRRTLRALLRIPRGSVTTYRALAEAVGAPDAQRAVGNTMASNPVPIYVPCHRVIRSDGSLGNYGGGVERKLVLLRAEGFRVGEALKLAREVVLGHRETGIFCRPGCPAARRAKPGKTLIVADSSLARGMGMRPCRVCRPLQ
jgi:O-6-methylguanine DNA methyltransferase